MLMYQNLYAACDGSNHGIAQVVAGATKFIEVGSTDAK